MYFLDDKDAEKRSKKDSKKELKKKKKSSKSKTSTSESKSKLNSDDLQKAPAHKKLIDDEYIIDEQKICDIADIWNSIFGIFSTEIKSVSVNKTEDIPEKTVRKIEKTTAKNTRKKSNCGPNMNENLTEDGEKKTSDVSVDKPKDMLTENTERRLREGALADQIIEQELDSIRRKIEMDEKAQQIREVARKKEAQRKEEELTTMKVNEGVFSIFTPWFGSVAAQPVTVPDTCIASLGDPSQPANFPAPIGRNSSVTSNGSHSFPSPLSRSSSVASGTTPPCPSPSGGGGLNTASGSSLPAPFIRRLTTSSGNSLPSPRDIQKDRSGSVGSTGDSSLTEKLALRDGVVPGLPRSSSSTYSTPTTQGGALRKAAVQRLEDSVSSDDIANFLRFVSTDGVNCVFYLPTRDGDAKDKKAVLKCNPDTTLLRLDIFAGDYVNSPVGGNAPSKATVIKSLTFDIFGDVLGVAEGRGPIVPLGPSVDGEHVVHILLHNKPEINLNFGDRITRDVVLVALPRHLAAMRVRHTVVVHDILSPKALLKSKQSPSVADGSLMGLSRNLFKLTSMFWVELRAKSLIGNVSYSLRLMVTRSDLVLQFFEPPEEFEGVTDEQGSELLSAEGAVSPEARQASLIEQMRVFLQSKWNPEFLTDRHFLSEMEIPFSTLEKVAHVGQNEADNTIEISTEDSNVKIRVDSAEKRRTITTFLETKRKQARKVVD